MDIPLLSEVKDLLRVQKALGGEPEYLLNNLKQAQSHHASAACFVALWEYLGTEPKVIGDSAAMKLAATLWPQIHYALREKVEEVSRNMRNQYYEPIQHQLTTKVMDNGGFVLGMSDAARNEAAAIRRKEGKGAYQGQRFIRPKYRAGDNHLYGVGRKQNVIGY